MEDLFDNIIYFILLAVLMIVPALSKKKKAAQMPPPSQSPVAENDGQERPKPLTLLDSLKERLEDEMNIFEVLEETKEEKQIEIAPEPEQIVEEPVEHEYIAGEAAFSNLVIEHDLGTSIEDDTSLSEGDLTKIDIYKEGGEASKKPTKSKIAQEFDPRKAVIYTEIISRKY